MENFRLIAIDPSSKFNGIAIFTIEPTTFNILAIEPVLLDTSGMDMGTMDLPSSSNRLVRTASLFNKLLINCNPLAICFEKPFIHGMFKGAFASLNAMTNTFLLSAKQFNPDLHVSWFSPAEVKKAIGGKAGRNSSGKDDMLTLASNHPLIKEHLDASQLNEHTIDALAIGLCWIEKFKSNRELLFLFRQKPKEQI